MHQKIPLPAIVAIVLLIVLVFIFATLDNDYDAIEQQIATTTINGDTSAENADSVDGASEGTNTAPEVTEVGSETVTAPNVTPAAPVPAPTPVAPEPVQPALTADTSDTAVAPVSSHAAFMQCLADAGVVIYGSRTCPACARLSQEYGGYDKMSPVYVECTVYSERCQKEMLVNYVPAVQIRGELYEGWGSPENLATVTGCPLPQ